MKKPFLQPGLPMPRLGTGLADCRAMIRSFLTLALLLAAASASMAVYETIRLTNNINQDSMTVRVGETVEISVRVNTSGTSISGFQCFLQLDEEVAVPVPYNASSTGMFRDNVLFPGIVLFADNHDLRFPDDPLPGHQLDWCYQTGISNPRPAYPANGTACFFRLRFLQSGQHTLGFDHDNNHFRNTLFWEGQSAVEYPFYREYPIHINVIGMDFGPLPDVYLTSSSPCDSLNLSSYISQLDAVDPDSIWYTWSTIGQNTTCSVDSLRRPGSFWMRFCSTGPGRQVDFAVTAHALNLAATDTLRVLRGDPPVIDEDVSGGDPFVTWPEDDETWLDLDEWVTDIDDPVSDLVWDVLPGTYTVSIEIDTVLRRAHFTAPPDWFGWDTLQVRVTDPGGMVDTSRLVAWVSPVNDAPTLLLPTLVQVHPGVPLILDLEALTGDIDDPWDDLVWQVSGGDTTLIAMRVHPTQHTLTLEVRAGTPLWTLVDATLRATDAGGLWDEEALHLEVASHPPIWEAIPDVLVPSGGSAQLSLNEFVADQDNSDAQLSLSIRDNNNIQVSVDPVSHVATFSASSIFTGVERLRAFALDPDGNEAVTTFLAVALQGGNPVVALVPDMLFLPGARDSLDLDPFVWDVDTPDDQMSWLVANMGLFHTTVREATRRVVYTAPMTPGTVDQSYYRAIDPQGHWGEDIGNLGVVDPSGRPLIFPIGEIWMRVSSIDSSVALDQMVYDYDNLPGELSWTVSQGNLVTATVRASDRRLILQSALATGTETLSLTVTDPNQMSASGPLVVHVTEGNPPIVSAFAPRFVIAGQVDTLRNLSNWVYDPDPGDRITWSFIDPPNSTVRAIWHQAQNLVAIRTDSLRTGTVQIGAVAVDMAQNLDMEWISVTSLENRAPVLESALLINPGEPRLLDLVVVSNEALRSLTATRAGDGRVLNLSEVVVANPTMRIHRVDMPAPLGSETWHIRGRDLPGYPQVAGNLGVDSLVLGSAVLGRPGDLLPSPDGSMSLAWTSGLSNGRWVIREQGGAGGRMWSVDGPPGGRARLGAFGHGLERLTADGWTPVPPQGEGSEGRPGDRLRPAVGQAQVQPGGFALLPAVPNPFNPATTLRFHSDVEGLASLEITDLAGRRVRSLWTGDLSPGGRTVRWDGRVDGGLPAASGVYFAWLRQGERQAVQKLMLLR